jgi:hypothetical protein
MKRLVKIKSIVLGAMSMIMLFTAIPELQAQKKTAARLRLSFVKVMDEGFTFTVTASARIDRRNTNLPDLEIAIYNETDSLSVLLATLKTDSNGMAEYKINDISSFAVDTTTNMYTVKAAFAGNETFRKASRSVSFKNADLQAELILQDSTYYISAVMTDKTTALPVPDVALGVQLERLFMAYQIEEFTVTDENGTILVPIEKGLPGIDGNLTLEVLLNDDDDYGTVKDVVVAPIGDVIVDESTFDERTMWSPRNKTPIFLLIFPNLLIFGMWGLILYLIMNLYKITKS